MKSDTIKRKSDTSKLKLIKHKMPTGKKALMLKALKDQLGIVSTACKQAEISRETHYHWKRTDKNYEYHVEEVIQELKDFGEHCLLKLMKEGNPMITWNFNKTKNKDRGYYERQELDIGGSKIPLTINLIEKSVEEIKNGKPGNQSKAEGNATGTEQ